MDATTVKEPAARAPVARRPPTPKTLQKRKLTLAEAAEQWERSKRAIEQAKGPLEEAAAVLLAHFEKTGRAGYKNVGWTWSGGGLVLDQGKVRELLGSKLPEYQKRSARSRSLRLLT